MSKVKKTVLQVAKQIAKNQGSTIVEAVNEMMIVLETDLHNHRMLIVDTDDGSYELASENLIETIAQAETALAEAEATAKTQQEAVDIAWEAWQVQVEKMKPLREAVSVASSAYIDAHQSSMSAKGDTK